MYPLVRSGKSAVGNQLLLREFLLGSLNPPKPAAREIISSNGQNHCCFAKRTRSAHQIAFCMPVYLAKLLCAVPTGDCRDRQLGQVLRMKDYEYSAVNGTSMSPLPRHGIPHERRVRENRRAGGRGGVKRCGMGMLTSRNDKAITLELIATMVTCIRSGQDRGLLVSCHRRGRNSWGLTPFVYTLCLQRRERHFLLQ